MCWGYWGHEAQQPHSGTRPMEGTGMTTQPVYGVFPPVTFP